MNLKNKFLPFIITVLLASLDLFTKFLIRQNNIQENVVIHTDIGYPLMIGKNCTIGHKAMLHGCTIGDNTLIGMGATVLNGAKIGKNCLVGAGALITEGKSIPDGSMVLGMPGKVVKQLDEVTIVGLLKSAENYQANAIRFMNSLDIVEG